MTNSKASLSWMTSIVSEFYVRQALKHDEMGSMMNFYLNGDIKIIIFCINGKTNEKASVE